MSSQNNTTSTNSVKHDAIFHGILRLYFFTKWYDIKYVTLIFLPCWPFYLKKIPTPYKIIRSVIYNDSFNPTRIQEVHIPDGVSSAVGRNETFPTTIRQTFPFTINSFFATSITIKSILWIGESKQCRVLCKRRRNSYNKNIAFLLSVCVYCFGNSQQLLLIWIPQYS